MSSLPGGAVLQSENIATPLRELSESCRTFKKEGILRVCNAVCQKQHKKYIKEFQAMTTKELDKVISMSDGLLDVGGYMMIHAGLREES